jgi:hypothetical protein
VLVAGGDGIASQPDPVGQVAAGSQGLDALGTGDLRADGQRSDVLIAGTSCVADGRRRAARPMVRNALSPGIFLFKLII